MQLLLKLCNLSLSFATSIKVTQPLANHLLDLLLHRGKCKRHNIILKILLKSEHFQFLRLFTYYCRWTHLSKGQPLCNSDKLYPSWIISKLLAVNSIQTSPTCRRSQFLRDITFLWTFNGVLIEENFEAKNFDLEFKDYYQESWSWEISIG